MSTFSRFYIFQTKIVMNLYRKQIVMIVITKKQIQVRIKVQFGKNKGNLFKLYIKHVLHYS